MIVYRFATESDLPAIVRFVDLWLSGHGSKPKGYKIASDYFVPRGRHSWFIRGYWVLLALEHDEIVGWAVMTSSSVLIHLLVAATHRGRGIGSELVKRLNPPTVRSKLDQSSGDPSEFYRKLGYVKVSEIPLGSKRNIDLFRKKGV